MTLPDPATIGPDTPLRLAVAARLAYPDGSMTVSGLRKERDRGRLVTEHTAGKEYTTLRNIEAMRRACQGVRKEPGSGSDRPATTAKGGSRMRPSGSFETANMSKAQVAALTTMQELKERLRGTSKRSTGPAAPVIPLRSKSETS